MEGESSSSSNCGAEGSSFLKDEPHIRFNVLRGDWVLVSPQRDKRPWRGQIEKVANELHKVNDPANPLCPGALRNNQRNPMYIDTYIFDNDFPALVETPAALLDASNLLDTNTSDSSLFQATRISGKCKVLCFHPDTKVTMALMTVDEICKVISAWINEEIELGSKFEWVQIFENKGEIMGCSNPHPHCQIWASSFLPNEPRLENLQQMQYYSKNKRLLLRDYLEAELKKEQSNRIVLSNESWVVLVPFWAVWPFETLLLPKMDVQRLSQLSQVQQLHLAEIIKQLTTKYDNLFQTDFPYSMGWHVSPSGKFNDTCNDHWLLHAHYYPPLLRSKSIKKFMVGYELLAQAQRDITPETAAERLRQQSATIHYSSCST